MKVFKVSYFLMIIMCLFFYFLLAVNAASIINDGASAMAPHYHTTPTRTVTATYAAATSTFNEQRNEAGLIKLYSDEWWITVYGSVNETPKRMMLLSGLLIVIGLYLCFVGAQLFCKTIAVMCFLTFDLLMWTVLANCRPEHGYTGDSNVMIWVPVCIGLLAVVAVYRMAHIMQFFVGALGGLAISVYICTWRYNLIIDNIQARCAFMVVLTLVCAFCMQFESGYTMAFSSSFVGAYIIFLGVDILARKGYIAGFESLLNGNAHSRVEYTITTFVYVFLALTLVLFLVSFVWQIKKLNGTKVQEVDKEPIEEEEEEVEETQQIYTPDHLLASNMWGI